MSEEKKGFSVDTESIKSETKETVNQVKDTIKNVNIKEDSKEAKGFILEMLKHPFEKMNDILDNESSKNFSMAIILIVIAVVAILVGNLNSIKYGIKSFISGVFDPLIYVLVPAIVLLICVKDNKKKLTTLISAATAAYIPYVLYQVVCILYLVSSGIGVITSPIARLSSAFYAITMFAATKHLINDESKALKVFMGMMLVLGLALYIL